MIVVIFFPEAIFHLFAQFFHLLVLKHYENLIGRRIEKELIVLFLQGRL